MGAVTGWTPNILVATPGSIPNLVSMNQSPYVQMGNKGNSVDMERRRRRRSRRR